MKYKYDQALMKLRIITKLILITLLSAILIASSILSFYVFINQLYFAIIASVLCLLAILYLYLIDFVSLIKERNIETIIENDHVIFNNAKIKYEDIIELNVYKRKAYLNKITIIANDQKYKIYRLQGFALEKLVALIVGGEDERRL